jgi:hypothetical protein
LTYFSFLRRFSLISIYHDRVKQYDYKPIMYVGRIWQKMFGLITARIRKLEGWAATTDYVNMEQTITVPTVCSVDSRISFSFSL